jgi:hypothetical protein
MSEEFAPKKAVKSQVKLKLAIQGPSGSGKTEGALALATNLKPDCKILLIDTENESASLYADRYHFDTIPLCGPYTPERYMKAMQVAMTDGYDFLIVDSITHEWNGEGGIMWQKDALDARPNSNSYTNWAILTPKHEKFVEFIKQLQIDTIVTMRTKQSYVLEANNKGKMVPKKLGMAPIQRDGIEYEYTLVFDVDMSNKATASKNRTTLFHDVQLDLRSPEVAAELLQWRSSGAEYVAPEPRQAAQVEVVNASRATKPLLIENRDRQVFWVKAQAKRADGTPGHSAEDIRVYLFERFKIDSTTNIPAAAVAEVLKWANEAKPVRRMADGEEKAREAAKILKLSESDIQSELSLAKGDWNAVYSSINSGEDARLAAQS